MILEPLPNNRFIDKWNIIKPLLVVSCKRVEEDILHIAFNCIHNPLYLITLYQDKGLVIFQCTEHSLHCVTISGEFPKGYEQVVTEYMEQLAIKLGLDKLSLEGRKGWIKKLKYLNWKLNGNMLERTL